MHDTSPSSSVQNPYYETMEHVWARLYDGLLAKGYRLRDRYRPDWKPSWLQCDLSLEDIHARHLEDQFEDCLPVLGHGLAVDATRVVDGKNVWLKCVRLARSHELPILRAVSSEKHRDNPHNHCVNLLDVFIPPELNGKYCIAVMPMLRHWYDPEPFLVAEGLAFIDQLLEGLAFLHELNITHGDIRCNNVMMHADALFPNGFNPLTVGRDDRALSLKDSNASKSRLDVPITYAFIDFEYGHMFESANERQNIPWVGGDGLLPEIQQPEPKGDEPKPKRYHDPFSSDIWSLGSLFLDFFVRPKVTLIPAITPLVLLMCERDPCMRPSAKQCVQTFRDAVHGLSWSLCYRLPPLRLIAWDATATELQEMERQEGFNKAYIERLVCFLTSTYGRPRLLI